MARIPLNKSARQSYSYVKADSNEFTGKTKQLIEDGYNYSVVSVTNESVTLATGGAGTTGKVSLANKGAILNADGSMVASYGDTSLTISGTALTSEKRYEEKKPEAVILQNLQDGEYMVDYYNGIIYYKKADATTTITASYKVKVLKVDTEIINNVAESEELVNISGTLANGNYEVIKDISNYQTFSVVYKINRGTDANGSVTLKMYASNDGNEWVDVTVDWFGVESVVENTGSDLIDKFERDTPCPFNQIKITYDVVTANNDATVKMYFTGKR